YLIWQRCASGTEPFVVMEDDLDIDAGFAVVLQLAEASISAVGFIRLAGLNSVAEATIRPLYGPYRLVRFLKGPAGTQCYAISPEAARKLISKADIWIEPVDDYLDRFWAHGVQSMAILPFRIHHDVD
ncbi:glycosyltransferase family 25 protein, partial [Rhizobiaceae sp. 2RAB30]